MEVEVVDSRACSFGRVVSGGSPATLNAAPASLLLQGALYAALRPVVRQVEAYSLPLTGTRRYDMDTPFHYSEGRPWIGLKQWPFCWPLSRPGAFRLRGESWECRWRR